MRLVNKNKDNINNTKENRIKELKQELKDTYEKIDSLEKHKEDIQKEILNEEIAPFKIGDYVMAEIYMGKKKQWKKCLLECVRGDLYVRPFKNDGTLSNKHQSLISFDNDYTDLIKPVEE